MDVVICDIQYIDVIVVYFIMYEHTVIFGYYREWYEMSACLAPYMYIGRIITNSKLI